ncbi:hypothetical protein Y1Q_0019881 [Alligator mississippiensis]|uniref:Uncharacterized protein n=1 Tax=Alligator mississippiensis TaxID=8496 RepID=A0A151PFR1_ALLMI|nr:hypothetical protein Y1Q_0019881 [Alligator mississippiensis]
MMMVSSCRSSTPQHEMPALHQYSQAGVLKDGGIMYAVHPADAHEAPGNSEKWYSSAAALEINELLTHRCPTLAWGSSHALDFTGDSGIGAMGNWRHQQVRSPLLGN